MSLAAAAVFLLSLAGLISFAPLTAYAVDNVSYSDWNDTTKQFVAKTENGVTELAGGETDLGTAGTTTWYIAQNTLNYTDTITITGTVHLILANGCNMTVTGSSSNAGINVEDGNTLYIYAQSTDEAAMGNLNATGDTVGTGGAGIGGGVGNKSGTVVINGGKITTLGGQGGAGIGGGYDNGTVIINGGIVSATGSAVYQAGERQGAGIGGGGGGGAGGTITINGGRVTAVPGGSYADAIGGGSLTGITKSASGTINYNGGIVNGEKSAAPARALRTTARLVLNVMKKAARD